MKRYLLRTVGRPRYLRAAGEGTGYFLDPDPSRATSFTREDADERARDINDHAYRLHRFEVVEAPEENDR